MIEYAEDVRTRDIHTTGGYNASLPSFLDMSISQGWVWNGHRSPHTNEKQENVSPESGFCMWLRSGAAGGWSDAIC